MLCPSHRSEVGRWASTGTLDASPVQSAKPAQQRRVVAEAPPKEEDEYSSDEMVEEEAYASSDDEPCALPSSRFPWWLRRGCRGGGAHKGL